MSGKKNTNSLSQSNHTTAVSDYPEKIPDSTVELADAKVIPDVAPGVLGSVSFTVSYGARKVTSGIELTPSETQDQPEVRVEGTKTYTLIIVDPDAPSPEHPKYRCFLHWLIVNIPAHDFARGEELVEYIGPSPPKGKHRYIFCLYEQHGRMKAHPPSGRPGFQPKQWAKEHGLSEEPAAVVFFYSQPDSTDAAPGET
jgi:protein FLOWERING LOCUS T